VLERLLCQNQKVYRSARPIYFIALPS